MAGQKAVVVETEKSRKHGEGGPLESAQSTQTAQLQKSIAESLKPRRDAAPIAPREQAPPGTRRHGAAHAQPG